MTRSGPGICTRCGFILNRYGMCGRPECSSNRPTHRPPSSKPTQDIPRANSTKGEAKCPACHGIVPPRARYCPYCRAPQRASATAAYANLEQSVPKPPRLPSIPDVEEKPPQQSETRCKAGNPEEDLADVAAKK